MVAVRNSFILVALAMLTGCASMSPEECSVSDWYAVGFTDGARGMPVSRFDRYREACGAHGVAPDFDAYRTGRNEGLQDFCQPEKGFNLGNSGRSNPGVCPAELKAAFAEAYTSGYRLFELRSAVHQLEREMNSRHQQLLALQTEQDELEASLISAEPTVEERMQMLLALKNLGEEMRRLEDEMLALEEEHAYHQQRLAAYEVSLHQSS